MPGPEGTLRVDTSELDRFLQLARRDQARVAKEFFQRGGQLVTAKQKREATKRFGTETTESRMQNPDPSRPKGIWAGSVRVEIVRAQREAAIGPNVPYDHWIEEGVNAPPGTIPSTHRGAFFQGHAPVEHATEESEEPVGKLFRRLVRGGLDQSVRGAGGTA